LFTIADDCTELAVESKGLLAFLFFCLLFFADPVKVFELVELNAAFCSRFFSDFGRKLGAILLNDARGVGVYYEACGLGGSWAVVGLGLEILCC